MMSKNRKRRKGDDDNHGRGWLPPPSRRTDRNFALTAKRLYRPKRTSRNTGNRGLEAIGGTTSLPITSPNLSFAEFLARMNKAIQLHRAEHELK